MLHYPSRTAMALVLACPLLLPSAGFAFEATDNAIAQRFLETVEAGDAVVTGYKSVESANDTVTISGLEATLADDDEARLTIDETLLSGAKILENGRLSVVTMTLKGVTIEDDDDDDVRITVKTINVADAVLPSPEEVEAKGDAAAPTYSRAELVDMLIDAGEEGQVPVARVLAQIDSMDGDLPTAGSVQAEGITVAAASLDDDGKKAMTDLGYESITLSLEMQANWDPDGGVLSLNTLKVSGEEAATLVASLRMSGVTREVMAELEKAQDNPEQAMGLMQNLLVDQISIRIDNDSLVDRVLDKQAKEAGSSREEFVGQLTGALPLMLSVINNADFQKKVASAATAFLKDPKSLTAKATPAAPVPFAQILGTAMMAPQSLPDILGVSISANED